MKKSFFQFLIERQDALYTDGDYVAVRPDEASTKLIVRMQQHLKIQDPIPPEKLHCTIAYSKKPLNILFTLSDSIHQAYIKALSSLNSFPVLYIESSSLRVRNNELKLLCGAISDYPDYIPHITLSYQEQPIVPFIIYDTPIVLHQEYHEKLKLS